MRSTPKKLLSFGLSLVFTFALPASLHASGFQTSYQSVASFSRGLGGAGVSHDDLADMYYNPAGLSLYEPGTIQFSAGFGGFSNDFEDQGSTRVPAIVPAGGEDGLDETVPNLSFQWIPENFLQSDTMQFGVFVGNAFGNQTEYDEDWIGRYQAVKSSLRVLDVSPTLSYSINDQTRVGAALSVQFSDAEISRALFTGGADGKATFTGDDIALGFAVGIVHELDNMTLGASFRSKVSHTLDVDLTIEGTPSSDGDFPAKADLDLPETVYLSASFDLPQYSKWNLYWTSRWTRWSRFDELRVEVDDPSVADSVTPQEWDDVWLHGIGVSYQYTDNTKFRFGITVDETPIPSPELRTPSPPENDRTWISFGLSHDFRDGGVLDVGINHQMIDDAEINNTDIILTTPFTVTDTLTGEFKDGDFTLLGVQYRKKF